MNGSPLETATCRDLRLYAWRPGDYDRDGPGPQRLQLGRRYRHRLGDDPRAAAGWRTELLATAHVAGSRRISATPELPPGRRDRLDPARCSSETPVAGASPVLESSTNGVHVHRDRCPVSASFPMASTAPRAVAERRTYYRDCASTRLDVVGGSTLGGVDGHPQGLAEHPVRRSPASRTPASSP